MNFVSELEKGKFVIAECSQCQNVVWPPSDFCDNCLGEVNWHEGNNVGKIIQFSKKGEKTFCVAEFENKIRIIGTVKQKGTPKIGDQIKLDKCFLQNGSYSFMISLV